MSGGVEGPSKDERELEELEEDTELIVLVILPRTKADDVRVRVVERKRAIISHTLYRFSVDRCAWW